MEISVNGQKQAFQEAQSVSQLLEQLGYANGFVAVAINQSCILRRNFPDHMIQAGDQIEILAPMAGG